MLVTQQQSQQHGSAHKQIFLWWTKYRYTAFAGLLLVITTVIIVLYYWNHPKPEVYPDSLEYIALAHHMQNTGQIVDPHRLPGFSLLIVLVFALAGQDNIFAITIANAIFFVLSTLEIYAISVLLFKRAWLAFVIGLLVGTNLSLLSFSKPVASEALALWLLVSLALVTVLFLRNFHKIYLWLATIFLLGLFFTRGEWLYVPLLFFVYLLYCALRQKQAIRPLVLHCIAALIVLYAALGGYIYGNIVQNHYAGITDIQNINEFGKVIQYGMQNDAPAQYTSIQQVTNDYYAQGRRDPYPLFVQHPELRNNHYTQIGEYAQAIIKHDFPMFVIKTIPLIASTLPYYYLESQVDPHGPMGRPLILLQTADHALYKSNILYLIAALVWIVLLFRKRTALLYVVQTMGLLILLSAWGIIFTCFAGYDSYIRFHTPLDPFLIIIIWGGCLLALAQLASLVKQRFIVKQEQPLLESNLIPVKKE